VTDAKYAFSLALALAALSACEHTPPFSSNEGGSSGPLIPGEPAQLTFSPGVDLIPEWLPDGSGFAFTAERRDRPDHDRCLAFMPRDGGTIARYACSTVAADDTLNVYDEAAFQGDSVAYVRSSTERFLPGLGPDRQSLVIAPAANPNAARLLQTIPFTTTWGATYDAISHLAWLGPGRLAFIGEHVSYPRACGSCVADTVRLGIGLVIADISGSGLALTRMPDGDSASSLAASSNGDTVYFTRNGDTRVFRRALAAGVTDTVLDFVIGVARDLSVSGGKLAAIVGGIPGGAGQSDRGGDLYLVEGQTLTELDATRRYRRPALSPDGRRIVVSGWDVVPTADLWLFDLP